MIATLSRQVAVTVVFGSHTEKLDRTFTSFARHNPFLDLHAFIIGAALPVNRVSGVTYHLRQPEPAWSHPIRDADFRRWRFIDELDADYALVVDGCDALCLCPLPEIPALLKGGWIAAAMEHPGGRYLEAGLYDPNFVNAGVTFWDIRASKPLRDDVLARGRIRFRNCVDDQLCLNEVLYTRYLDHLTILPSTYNYRGFIRRRQRGWPTTQNLDGVKIYHHDECLRALDLDAIRAAPDLPPLEPDAGPVGPWVQRWRRFQQKLKPDLIR